MLPLKNQLQHGLSDQDNSSDCTDGPAAELCKGILQSYKNIASSKMKNTVSNILEPHLKRPAVNKTSRILLKQMFRRRHKTVKHVLASQKKNKWKDILFCAKLIIKKLVSIDFTRPRLHT